MKNTSILSYSVWKMRGAFLFIEEIFINFNSQYIFNVPTKYTNKPLPK